MNMQSLALPPGPAEGFDLGGSDESLERLRRYFAEFGDLYRVFAPARGVYNYVINHPDDIKRVLLSNHRNYTKGEGMDRVKILLGNGIMTSEGDFWRRQRRMMQPSFHRRVIDQFGKLIREVNDKFAARWADKAARDEAVNISDDTSELTLEIVLRSIFGSDLERLEKQLGANPFQVVAKEQNRDLKFAFRFRSLTKLVQELINRRRREPEEHFDFLAMLMASRDRDNDQAMSDKELIDEVLTLIVAGHETTAAALTSSVSTPIRRPSCTQRPIESAAMKLWGWPRRSLWHSRTRCCRRHCACIHRDGSSRGAPCRPTNWADMQSLRAPMYSSAPTCCTGTRGFGAIRKTSSRNALPASMPRSAINSPTFLSRSVRGIASAKTSRCSRCWCMCRPCRGAFG
jgi:Cytochrome P450